MRVSYLEICSKTHGFSFNLEGTKDERGASCEVVNTFTNHKLRTRTKSVVGADDGDSVS